VSWWVRTFGSEEAVLQVAVAGVVCGVVGVHVVLRRLAFLTMGLTHACFPGLVIAAMLGINLVLGSLVFSLLVVAVIVLLGATDRVETSSAIGVALSGGFALGALLVSASDGFSQDLTAYLVGSLATVSPTDVAISAAAGAVVLVALGLFHKELVLATFDPAGLVALGYPALVLDLLLMGAVAITVVTALPAVGVILAVSLLVSPAAAARLWTERVSTAMALAAAIGVGSGLLGLWISMQVGTSAGATVALVAGGAMALSAILSPTHGAVASLRRTRPIASTTSTTSTTSATSTTG
jgi:ABC-type Mn2+/Zn2+ transport system permease subunit